MIVKVVIAFLKMNEATILECNFDSFNTFL